MAAPGGLSRAKRVRRGRWPGDGWGSRAKRVRVFVAPEDIEEFIADARATCPVRRGGTPGTGPSHRERLPDRPEVGRGARVVRR
ncbi:hypothetical protein GCM10023214_48230 [Amycolatopsis dongchuanensis]|uniref:Uncharacterized protein n=1 Tax=Amycolatopsis dongchuanensis TaxID=1070866 RepID=A0ABP9R0R6_9PSEU